VALVVDPGHLGTSEAEWAASGRLAQLPALTLTAPRRLVVVAPHPDDEIFGTAGLMQTMLVHRIPIEIIAATDGEGSHPLAAANGLDLRTTRFEECVSALQRLGWHDPMITRLGLPDGQVGQHGDALRAALVATLSPGDLCLAPWWYDGHPDHDACGEAARQTARSVGARMLGYLVWGWHWAQPDGTDLPWEDCRRLDFTRRLAARKRWATGAFVSQTRSLGPDHHGAPLLPSPLLRRFWRRYEVFVEDPAGTS
jgi:LmbE family N-acetylglucosaminyl deacetylase